MANPIEQAERLRTLLGRVLDEIVMAPKWKASVEEMVRHCDTTIEGLRHIDSEIVPLELRDAGEQHARTFEFFKALPGGRIQKGQPEYERLVTQSATLQDLYRAGFEMPAMTKFTDQELKLAKELGENFQEWNDPWRNFTLATKHGANYREPRVKSAAAWDGFLQLLRRWNVITDYTTSFKDYTKNEFVPAPIAKILRLHQNNVMRFDWTRGSEDFDSLLSGHWFSAFAYSIIVDHLERLGSGYETYTLVRYSAPRDVIRSSGDFDVIARTGSKIVMIECKSGSLKGKDKTRNDFPEIIDKSQALRRVFEGANSEITDYSFWLIYNPYLNDPEDVARELEGHGIVAVRPDSIRGEVRRSFDLPMRVAAV